jgi:glucose/mannose-6-phosphate isomerase
MLDKVMDLPYQMLESLTLYSEIRGYDGIDEVVVIGMGGSGIVGDFVKGIIGDEFRVSVVKSSNIPRMDNNTLAIAVTYSGKTRETLIAVKKAASYCAKTVLVTSNSNNNSNKDVVSNENEQGIQYIRINGNGFSRTSLGYMLLPVLLVLEHSNVISNIRKDVKEAVNILCNIAKDKSRFEELKYRLNNKMLAIYSNEFTQATALRWKQMLNENAKMHCYYDVFPELLHNEIETWYKDASNHALVMLRDIEYEKSKEHGYDLYATINKAKELIRSKGADVIELFSIGNSRLARLLSLSYVGDIMSVHLAYANNIDPSKIPNIEYIKSKSMEERVAV